LTLILPIKEKPANHAGFSLHCFYYFLKRAVPPISKKGSQAAHHIVTPNQHTGKNIQSLCQSKQPQLTAQTGIGF
jgi:hypothetical protein